MAWILDVDGVVWLAGNAIPGAPAAIAWLRDAGERVLFVTNNSSLPVGDYVGQLTSIGIPTDAADVVTSAQAAAALLGQGSTALVCAGDGVVEALEARGVQAVRDGDADAVVVGFHRDFDYERLRAAFVAVHHGARLIGTNDDATYPTPDGPIPGGGAILAAVATATGLEPEVAGKPYEPMAALVRERLEGRVAGSVMVGDRPSTDGRMATTLGVRFALVLSGVTSLDDLPVEPAPDLTAPDLASLVETELD